MLLGVDQEKIASAKISCKNSSRCISTMRKGGFFDNWNKIDGLLQSNLNVQSKFPVIIMSNFTVSRLENFLPASNIKATEFKTSYMSLSGPLCQVAYLSHNMLVCLSTTIHDNT